VCAEHGGLFDEVDVTVLPIDPEEASLSSSFEKTGTRVSSRTRIDSKEEGKRVERDYATSSLLEDTWNDGSWLSADDGINRGIRRAERSTGFQYRVAAKHTRTLIQIGSLVTRRGFSGSSCGIPAKIKLPS
jgi:hypothetical protein